MKFLVTGASGFLGSAVARHLHSHGHRVRVLLRPVHDPAPYESLGYEPVTGDLLDQASLRSACRGMDGVFHVAALYSFWTPPGVDIYRLNVGGTENLLRMAESQGIPRLVFTSSVGAMKSEGRGIPVTEESIGSVDDLPDDYHRSKLLSELACMAANGDAMQVVVVNPTTPIGENDVKPTPTGRIILEFLRHRFPGYFDGEINFVDVRDAARGHLLAFERGRAGQRYILGGENSSFRGAYEILAAVTGLRRTPVRVPYAAALPLAAASQVIQGRMLGRAPFLPLQGLRAVRHPMHANHAKATAELGYQAGNVSDAFRRAAEWFTRNRYVGFDLPLSPVAGGTV